MKSILGALGFWGPKAVAYLYLMGKSAPDPAWCRWHTAAYIVYIQRILFKMALGWCGGDEMLNKVYETSRSFVKLRSNPWCHMDYFNDVLATFLDLGTFQLYMQGQTALRFHEKYLNLCSEDERRSYRFETTWGWTNPLTTLLRMNKQLIRSLLRQKS